MASQRPGGRGGRPGQAARSSPTARPASATSRQPPGKQKSQPGTQRAASAAPAQAGNGAAGSGARSPSSASGPATASRKAASGKAAPGKAASAAGTASTSEAAAAGGPLRRLWSPFRQMGGPPLITLILSLYGLGASVYLTIAHYDTAVTLVCSDKGLINCEEVTTSPESIVFGVFPVAVLGLAFYVFMVAINSPWGWRLRWPAVRLARLGSVILGMCFVLYLIYAEVDEIHAICLWCTSVHVATFLIFAVLVFHAAFNWEKPAAASRS